MTSVIIVLLLLVAMVSFLLYQIAVKYETWVTTICIVITLVLSISSTLLVYNSLGYPKEVHLFEEKWVLHHYIPDDDNKTFILLVQSPGDKPRLVSFKISSKEKYEKQKKGLTAAQEGTNNGQMMEGAFDSETEEFRFYEFSMKASSPKE